MCYKPGMSRLDLHRRHFLAAGGAAAAALLAPGCSKSAEFVTGSKNFQEQWILASLIARLVAARTDVSTGTKDFGGTMLAHTALVSGNIGCYVEYTGTALTAVLKMEPSRDTAAVYQSVKKAYAEQFDLVWMPPLGFENTFAILVRRKDAEAHGLRKVSDLARVAGDMRAGFAFEFYDRPDGYRGLVSTYGLSFGKPPKQMKLGLVYRALADGQVDVIAGNSTDGLISTLDLVMLTDDRKYFPPYDAAPVVRKSVVDKHPGVAAALESLGGKISAEAMRKANYAVDGDKKTPAVAARELLTALDLG